MITGSPLSKAVARRGAFVIMLTARKTTVMTLLEARVESATVKRKCPQKMILRYIIQSSLINEISVKMFV